MLRLFSRPTASMAMVVAVLAAAATLGGCSDESDEALKVHVGGTMRPVMEKLAEMYKDKTGQEVKVNSAGSGELLAHIEQKKEGDVYVCHDPFLAILMKRDLGVDGWTVAHLTPVLVVKKGNPLKIKGLKDAVTEDVALVMTDFEKSTLGWLLPTMLKKAGFDIEEVKKLPKLKTVRKGSQAANDVQTGSSDAATVWNAVWYLRRDKLDKVDIVAEHLPTSGVDAVTTATAKKSKYFLMPVKVTVATLKCSDQPKAAKAFAEWLASEEAAKIIKSYGFAMPPKTVKEYADGTMVSP